MKTSSNIQVEDTLRDIGFNLKKRSHNNELETEKVLRHFTELNREARQSFLSQLLRQCKATDLSFIHGFVSNTPLLKIDFVSEFPGEIAVNILSMLSASDIAAGSLVNKTWHRIIQDNDLWRRACVTRNWTPLKTLAKSVYSMFWSTPSLFSVPWKSVFMANHVTRTNWVRGRYSIKPAVLHHEPLDEKFTLAFDITLQSAVSVSVDQRDSPAHIWATDTGISHLTLVGHTAGISVAKICSGLIVTGSTDGSIRVWSKNGSCLCIMTGHEDEVDSLHIDAENRLLLSGSRDHTVRLWLLSAGSCLCVFRGHTGSITALQFLQDRIVSASCDRTLRIWNLETKECENVLSGHSLEVMAVQVGSKHIVSGSSDTTIKIWDLVTKQCLKTLRGHSSAVTCLQFDDDKLVSGSSDTTMHVWSFPKGELLYSLEHHTGAIWNLQFDKSKLMTSSFDRSVLVWDFSSPVETQEESND